MGVTRDDDRCANTGANAAVTRHDASAWKASPATRNRYSFWISGAIWRRWQCLTNRP